MIFETKNGSSLDSDLISNYLDSLVNRFFKILPIREENEESLGVYLNSFQQELIGCKDLITALNNDALFLSLLSSLQYLIDNPECPVQTVRRNVFNSISVCKKLKSNYTSNQN